MWVELDIQWQHHMVIGAMDSVEGEGCERGRGKAGVAVGQHRVACGGDVGL